MGGTQNNNLLMIGFSARNFPPYWEGYLMKGYPFIVKDNVVGMIVVDSIKSHHSYFFKAANIQLVKWK